MKNVLAASAIMLCITASWSVQAYDLQPEATYFGLWKYNPAKSDIGTITITFKDLGNGEFQQASDDGRSYRFRFDGKEYDDGAGRTANWNQLGPSSWEATTSVKGKVAFTSRFTLSQAGDSMTLVNKYAQAGMQDVTMTYRRAGTGQGLAGQWASKVELPPFEMLIEPIGETGIRMSSPGMYEVRAQFDGKPYPASGAMAPQGSTASFERDGRASRTREVTGSAVFEGRYTVSDDGQTLTETGYEGKIKRTWVFDRVPGK